MTDIEIANSVEISPIIDVAKKLKIKKSELELYGHYKAKNNKKVNTKKKTPIRIKNATSLLRTIPEIIS